MQMKLRSPVRSLAGKISFFSPQVSRPWSFFPRVRRSRTSRSSFPLNLFESFAIPPNGTMYKEEAVRIRDLARRFLLPV